MLTRLCVQHTAQRHVDARKKTGNAMPNGKNKFPGPSRRSWQVRSYAVGFSVSASRRSSSSRKARLRSDHRSVQGSPIGTGAGLFLFDDSILLEGGGMYFVEVHTNLIALAHLNSGSVSTASGEIAVVVSTVPEPTSLALLFCGVLLARLRGGRTPSCSSNRSA